MKIREEHEGIIKIDTFFWTICVIKKIAWKFSRKIFPFEYCGNDVITVVLSQEAWNCAGPAPSDIQGDDWPLVEFIL
jgi:hypothetical protein